MENHSKIAFMDMFGIVVVESILAGIFGTISTQLFGRADFMLALFTFVFGMSFFLSASLALIVPFYTIQLIYFRLYKSELKSVIFRYAYITIAGLISGLVLGFIVVSLTLSVISGGLAGCCGAWLLGRVEAYREKFPAYIESKGDFFFAPKWLNLKDLY